VKHKRQGFIIVKQGPRRFNGINWAGGAGKEEDKLGMERNKETAYSVNGVPIRLTYERWFHIIENHDDLASYYFEVLEAIENLEFVIRGNKGSLKATKNTGKRKWLVVIYREISKEDGFVITAYFLNEKPKGDVIWKR